LTLFLHLLQVTEHLIFGQPGQLGDVLDFDETFDAQRVMDPETWVGLVCHAPHNTPEPVGAVERGVRRA
jgi:hypothetical protein